MCARKLNITDHFDGKKFYNLEPHTHNTRDFWKFILNRKPSDWPDRIEDNYELNIENQVSDKIKVTYVNHATVLVQVGGLNILTDPIWSKRSSPIKFFGPKRIHDPGIAFDDLPRIDVVLISHDHYDHLDRFTVKKLHKKHKPLFIVGLQVGRYLKRISRKIHFIELDWWEEHSMGQVIFTFVPAHHWSSRVPFVRNDTLWGGFMISSKHGSVYFAGDTGWGKHFEQIAEKFKDIKISLLPIGSYLPRWFMKYSHIDPEEAVKAHKILNSQLSVGIHFHCFKNLADEEFNQSLIDLDLAMKKYDLDKDQFIPPKPGQEFTYK